MTTPELAAQVAAIQARHDYAEAQTFRVPLGWEEQYTETFSERCHADRAALLALLDEYSREAVKWQQAAEVGLDAADYWRRIAEPLQAAMREQRETWQAALEAAARKLDEIATRVNAEAQQEYADGNVTQAMHVRYGAERVELCAEIVRALPAPFADQP